MILENARSQRYQHALMTYAFPKNAAMHMSEFAKKLVFNKPDAFRRHTKPVKFWNSYVKFIVDLNFSVMDMLK